MKWLSTEGKVEVLFDGSTPCQMSTKDWTTMWIGSSYTKNDAEFVLAYLKTGSHWMASDHDEKNSSFVVEALLAKKVSANGSVWYQLKWASPRTTQDKPKWVKESEISCDELVKITRFKKAEKSETTGSVTHTDPQVDFTKAGMGSSYGGCRPEFKRKNAKQFDDQASDCLVYVIVEILENLCNTTADANLVQDIRSQLDIQTNRGRRADFSRAQQILRPYDILATRCRDRMGKSDWTEFLMSASPGFYMCKTKPCKNQAATHCILVNTATKTKVIYDVAPRFKNLQRNKDLIVEVWSVVTKPYKPKNADTRAAVAVAKAYMNRSLDSPASL